MGNQQGIEALKGWLAGMIDADGCVHVTTRVRKGYTVHTPIVDIATSCQDTAEILVQAINKLDVGCVVNHPKKSRNTTQVRVPGIKRCYRLLIQLEPYMATKRNEADLTLKWCLSRMMKGKPGRGRGCGYDAYEDELIVRIKQRKKLRSLRGQTPSPCWLEDPTQGEDMVHALDES